MRYISWLTIFFCCAWVYFPITDTDVWWHLSSAREMFARSAFLYSDPISISTSPWLNIHWLYQIVIYSIYGLSGALGLVWIKMVLFGTALSIQMSNYKTYRLPFFSLILFSLGMYQVRYLVLVRPIVFTLLFMAIFIWAIHHFQSAASTKNKQVRLIIVVSATFILWVNVQGLFVLGPVILFSGAFFNWNQNTIQARWVRVCKWLGYSCILYLTSIISPYGTKILFYPLRLFDRINPAYKNVFSYNITENIPIWKVQQISDVILAISVVAVSVVYLWSFNKTHRMSRNYSHLYLFICFLVLAVMANRNILLFYFIAIPILIQTVTPILKFYSLRFKHLKSYKVLIPLGIVLTMGVSQAKVIAIYPHTEFISPFRVPIGWANWVQHNKMELPSGNIFCSDRYGGYIYWRTSRRVMIDGRFILKTPQFFKDYLGVLDQPYRFDAYSARYNINQVVIPIAIFDRFYGLSAYLYHHPNWNLRYIDGSTVYFTKKETLDVRNILLEDSLAVQEVNAHIRMTSENNFILKESMTNVNRFIHTINRGQSYND